MKHGCLILLILLLFIATGCAQQVAQAPPTHEPAPADEKAAEGPSLPTLTPPAPEPTPMPPPLDTTRQGQLALAAKLGLPEGYRAEVLLEPQLLSPIFIAATSDNKLLVAEHYGARLLRIDPVTAKVEFIYQMTRGGMGSLAI